MQQFHLLALKYSAIEPRFILAFLLPADLTRAAGLAERGSFPYFMK